MTYQLIYPDYKDLATGKTLVVTPGSAYTIALSSGRVTSSSSYPNDGRWTSATSFVAQDLKGPIALAPEAATAPVAGTKPADSKEGAV